MQVTVAGTPRDTVVIDLRRIGSLSGIQEGHYKKLCDYMIVFQSAEQEGVLFVELKRTLHDSNTDGHRAITAVFADPGLP